MSPFEPKPIRSWLGVRKIDNCSKNGPAIRAEPLVSKFELPGLINDMTIVRMGQGAGGGCLHAGTEHH